VLADPDGHESAQVNGPPLVVDNGGTPCGGQDACGFDHTFTVTQIVQTTESTPVPTTLPDGSTGTTTTTTTTTYTATFDINNNLVPGSASKQSTITTQTSDGNGNPVGDAKSVTGPTQKLVNNGHFNLTDGDSQTLLGMKSAASHWYNTSVGDAVKFASGIGALFPQTQKASDVAGKLSDTGVLKFSIYKLYQSMMPSPGDRTWWHGQED